MELNKIEQTSLALPPVNAAGLNHLMLQTRAHDPVAQAFIEKNTKRLQELGIVDKLTTKMKETKPESQSFSKVPDDDGETVKMRVRGAHERLQAFIHTVPEDELNPQPPFAPHDPLAPIDSLAPPLPFAPLIPFAFRPSHCQRRGSRR